MTRVFGMFALLAVPMGAAWQPAATWPPVPESITWGKPSAVAVDPDGSVWILQRGSPALLRFSPSGALLDSFSRGLFQMAHGLKIDPQGNLWTTDAQRHVVIQFSPNGRQLRMIGELDKPGTDRSHFNRPADIAFSPTGDMYVADGYANSRVVQFDRTGRFIREWGSRGTRPGEFNLPHAITVDRAGRVYVGDRENQRIQIFEPDGTFIKEWRHGYPYGLALASNGDLWMGDGRNNRVIRINPDGEAVDRLELPVSRQDGEGAHMLAVDRAGALYVAETGRFQVRKFIQVADTAAPYFPAPDTSGGWRRTTTPEETRRLAGLDPAKLDEAFEYAQSTSPNGGLLVVRNGWLAYEKYFGRGHRRAAPNLASVGKSFTSIAMGILLSERADVFPQGLEQRAFSPALMPPAAFPLTDRRKSEIRLGQLLAMTAGIRGNNPGYIGGQTKTYTPEGPDGVDAMRDSMAFGREIAPRNTLTLWTEPGGGYSYSTASVQIVSAMIRHVTGGELEEYVRTRIAEPLGWGPWGYGYRQSGLEHTPGGGGIAARGTDILRFLYMLLHEGQWQGRQLVPQLYVRHCARRSPYNPHFPFSLQFDINEEGAVAGVPADAFWKTGSGGHAIYVVPSLNLVAFKLGGRDGQYSSANTGLPAAPRSTENRFWTGDAPPDAAGETLRRVVAAVQ